MEKCLVTKLHGKVSGDLPYFGALKITVKKTDNITTTTQRRLVLRTKDDNCRIFTADGSSKLSDKGDLSNPSSSFVFKNMYRPSSGDNKREIFFLDGDYTVYITSKYNIISLEKWGSAGNYSFDIDELKYSTLIDTLYMDGINVTGDISSLKDLTALTNLTLDSSNVIGDISSLSSLTALTNFTLKNLNVTGSIASLSSLTALTNLTLDSSNVTGSIASLSSLTALTNLTLKTLNVTGDISSLSSLTALTNFVSTNNLKITGTFESLVSALSAKRTSGSCIYWLSGSNITYNGERWTTGKKFVEFNSVGCEVYDYSNDSKGSKIASYVKSTGTWSYNN